MNNKEFNPPSHSMSVGDIWFVLFRHKWKIIFMSLVGMGLVTAYVLQWPNTSWWPDAIQPKYRSQAKLFIKYVLEAKSGGSVATLKTPDERGENIINTEVEILTSADLRAEAKERVLQANPKLPNFTIGRVNKELKVLPAKQSNVILLEYANENREVVQPFLQELINVYKERHGQLRDAQSLSYERLKRETEVLKNDLARLEDSLIDAKKAAGVTSLDESRRLLAEQLGKTQQDLLDTRTQLAERQTAFQELCKQFGFDLSLTNLQARSPDEPVPAAVQDEYAQVIEDLAGFRKQQQIFSITYAEESNVMKAWRQRIREKETAKRELERAHPALLTQFDARGAGDDPTVSPKIALANEWARIAGLTTRTAALTNQLQILETAANRVQANEARISGLQREKELMETRYKYLNTNLEQSRVDEALGVGSGRVSNIADIQRPTAASPIAPNLARDIAIILFATLGLVLVYAFVRELYLDRTFRRPAEVQANIGVPLFLSIPQMKINGSVAKALLTNGNGNGAGQKGRTPAVAPRRSKHLPPWHHGHALRPFYDTLRDRLITFFEIKNIDHKPKLVAVTSCEEGSGVSTVAAGLAASLSETGEGNVLLVDMNERNGAAHHFSNGNLALGIDEALEPEKRDQSLVQDNLYVVSEGKQNKNVASVLSTKFKNLVPRLKASDYDYIIFDMPPVSQISITPRLSRFMDLVFMVVESERTDRDLVKRASRLVSGAGATQVGVVLNKIRRYVPRKLQQDV